ncbi:MAG: VTT domain-containing protein [Chloroflexi bacterium]|nr:VTT domain-containing protein [Chloroflexota bacterium]
MSDFLLTQIINYGAPIIGGIVLIGAIGLPLPCTLLIIAAGAFARQGILSWPVTALVGLVSVVIGDGIGYAMGFYAREKILQRFSGTPRWIQAEQAFQRWGPMSIFFSRFFVTAIAVPVNLLSGTAHFPYKRFFLFDLAGETVWIFGFGGLGYFFGSEWELVSDFVSDFGGLTLGLLLLGIGLRLGIRWLGNHHPAKTKVSEG